MTMNVTMTPSGGSGAAGFGSAPVAEAKSPVDMLQKLNDKLAKPGDEAQNVAKELENIIKALLNANKGQGAGGSGMEDELKKALEALKGGNASGKEGLDEKELGKIIAGLLQALTSQSASGGAQGSGEASSGDGRV